MSAFDLGPVFLTLKLASVTLIILYCVSIPLAWWLANTPRRVKVVVETIVALPLVLPPTVLGFYLLIMLGPNGPIGGPWLKVVGQTLTFSFSGLVLASVIYSLPFVVQPLQNTFEAIGRGPIEAASNLGAGSIDIFVNIIVPLSARGFVTAGVLGFAHTLGEFGVVLMVGGNIPGETRVLSVAILEHVETLDYQSAHFLSAGLIIFSFLVLMFVYIVNRQVPFRFRGGFRS